MFPFFNIYVDASLFFEKSAMKLVTATTLPPLSFSSAYFFFYMHLEYKILA